MIILIVFLILLDQVSKFLTVRYVAGAPIKISDFFSIEYVRNEGAAFGIMQGKQTFFIVLTCIVVLLLSLYFYKNFSSMILIERLGISFFIAGAVGNLIDRVFRGYVVDMISLKFFGSYNFPVFNFADIYINIGVLLFVYLMLFDKKKI